MAVNRKNRADAATHSFYWNSMICLSTWWRLLSGITRFFLEKYKTLPLMEYSVCCEFFPDQIKITQTNILKLILGYSATDMVSCMIYKLLKPPRYLENIYIICTKKLSPSNQIKRTGKPLGFRMGILISKIFFQRTTFCTFS